MELLLVVTGGLVGSIATYSIINHMTKRERRQELARELFFLELKCKIIKELPPDQVLRIERALDDL